MIVLMSDPRDEDTDSWISAPTQIAWPGGGRDAADPGQLLSDGTARGKLDVAICEASGLSCALKSMQDG
jgi:hypothetical protein